MYGHSIERINLSNSKEREELVLFLKENQLDLDNNVDYSVVIRENGKIKATCSKSKNVLKCFAVSSELRGEGISEALITELNNKLFEEGIYHSFIFTKPLNIPIFQGLNYKLIAQVENVALLENGMCNINSYLQKLKEKHHLEDSISRSALVMNCNPFTKGHRFLIEQASKESDEVLVFIVQEDKSVFPFNVRYRLVKEGVKDLQNVKVIEGGPYIISSATFPSYFLREESKVLKAYTELDSEIFAKYFCQILNIEKRYVGEEPYCNVTRQYNESLKSIFSKYNKELVVIPRKEDKNQAISASRVRNMIRGDDWEGIVELVPTVTYDFLLSTEAESIIFKIRQGNSPH
ncbi:[citrate (pro-3S)-lyase] ligase [Hathewaya proteolytica DSM 3090]|uniref:[Citrate [pro-3S]-lyase] ligase n=1 Tax=Hathewaya proteolytica DSM 3090 TaxID=1121331 RepID=A0A1M6RG20_9CLOT|nr:[citrate (pro-3S)-lyase] ligase [Hathewaya proteolytica]SHK31343.1 [citrate (pro-3S)-lyase] ligase [Hathewaya proteolytica DSM 3090]